MAEKTTKQLLKEPDQFITFSSRALGFARAHEREITMGVIGFFAVVLLIIGLNWYMDRQETKALQAYEKAQNIYVMALQGTDPASEMDEVIALLDGVLDDYGSTGPGRLALVIKGHALNLKKEHDGAVAVYGEALDQLGHDPMMANLIKNSMAYVYEGQGNLEKAAELFEEVAHGENPVAKEDASFALGRVYEEMGQEQKSREAFLAFADEYPQSRFARLAREKTGAP